MKEMIEENKKVTYNVNRLQKYLMSDFQVHLLKLP